MNAPTKVYWRNWAALMVLLFLTWGLSYINMRPFNVVMTLTIAALKSLLVLLYFMHVRHSSRLTWLFAAGGFIWLAFLLTLTLGDYLMR